ncbi:uncharacterized protein Z518_00448 [Rhinocladiella mackenziei CBS 650.93]|uniref:Zn(2)-C6 fungal-type domain-containing protein n=1 Tax=Rhinocladiella mackenziei CBS 650.93 TaxID=1442369 RepID=A0A0D2ITG6_9EURO|nr:uncharacterized protein Z518_00448 [Rhinocladiella mackenziei CBS 650.93]KIX09369.1 hypothetical protein Z518_00448 [Rhinocladiella mackenziei CBS 650.93]
MNSEKPIRRKRMRDVHSCIPCHRRKVKCDRKLPCDSCNIKGLGKECFYSTPRKGEANVTTPNIYNREGVNHWRSSLRLQTRENKNIVPLPLHPQPKPMDYHALEDQESVLRHRGKGYRPSTESENGGVAAAPPNMMFARHQRGKAKFKGPSHWVLLAAEFEELSPFLFGKEQASDSINQQLRDLKQFYPVRAYRNYPFRGVSITPWTKEHVYSIVPPRDVADRFIENYFDSFEKTHRMLHRSVFAEEMQNFWNSPWSPNYEWLAQLLIMLALGCPTKDRLEDTRLIGTLLDGAEACLMQTRFMAKPTLTTIRVMTMMAIAKQIDLVSFDDSDGVWSFLGLIIRFALSMGLHRDPKWFESMSIFEAEMRKRLWTTLVFIDSQNSLESGMPLLLQSDDYDTPAPLNFKDDDLRDNSITDPTPEESDDVTESMFQIILSRSFPTVLNIIRRINRPLDAEGYRMVLEYEAQIRDLLQMTGKIYRSSKTKDVAFSGDMSWKDFQRMTLEIYLRRALLALHLPFFTTADAATLYPTSHWSALESSLAIIVIQRTLYEERTDPTSIEWFAELFKGDFFLAGLFVALGIRRKSFKTTTPPPENRLAEAEIASHTLDACLAIWASKVGISADHFKSHLTLGVLIAAIKSDEWKKPLAVAMEEVAATTIATVTASMEKRVNGGSPIVLPP